MFEREPLSSLAGIVRESLRSLEKSISNPPLSSLACCHTDHTFQFSPELHCYRNLVIALCLRHCDLSCCRQERGE